MTRVRIGEFGRGLAAAFTVGAIMAALPAGADVYSWTDEHGVLNFGNVDPPVGAATSVIVREAPPRPAAAGDATRQAELRALAARVRQLEAELGQDGAPPAYAAPPGVYPPAPYPAVAAYPAMVPPQTPAAYPPPPPLWSMSACDPVFGDCFGGMYPGYLPPTYTVYVSGPLRQRTGFHRDGGHRAYGRPSGGPGFGASGHGHGTSR
jgi:Domain of unknown function (DUF4124)